jgi:hypothetical protein
MPKNHEGLLSNMATTIGSTMGMVAAKTEEFTRLVKAKERGVAKSLGKKVRQASRRVGIARSPKPSGKTRNTRTKTKRSPRRATSRKRASRLKRGG